MSPRREDSSHVFSRRQLLKGAALGLTAGGVGGFAHASQATAQDSSKEFEITGGELVDAGHGVIEMKDGGAARRFSLTGETSVWKGGESLPPALKEGDDLMVKVRPSDDVALRVWANLWRVEGTVVEASRSGYIIRPTDLHNRKDEVALELADGALFSDYTSEGKVSRRDLTRGATVDAIGERLPGGDMRATLLYVHDTGGGNEPAGSEPEVTSAATYTYYGYATWFYCGNGAGACGTCRTSNSNQGAWPNLSSGCSCCSYYCCNCSQGCENQLRLYCGSRTIVQSACDGRKRRVYIADCGPKQSDPCGSSDLCGRRCSDCGGYYNPVIDRSSPTFAAFYDPAYRGCFSCNVSV